MDDALTMILAGGVGSRLYPLTADRAKPAVPFGGQYRIIDFALSNCVHSGLRRILVLPQYKSHSMMKHLRDGWSLFNPALDEYITPVPPQMRTDDSWYQGTADAIYQNLYLLERSGAKYVVILSGDHIYRMDYAEMLQFHRFTEADVTVACLPVSLRDARQFGVMGVDRNLRIRSFDEKPERPQPIPDAPDRALASMGVYVFSIDLLIDALHDDHADPTSRHDFGHDILPKLIQQHQVMAYQFGTDKGRVSADCYWRDVGTIDAYYEANMDLLLHEPPLNLYQPNWEIRTANVQSPPARTCNGSNGTEPRLVNSIISAGSVVTGGTVVDSILSPRVTVDEEARVVDSILFEGVTVGSRARISRCIVEKGVRIPPGTVIDSNTMARREGVVISAKGVVVIPSGFRNWPRQEVKRPALAKTVLPLR